MVSICAALTCKYPSFGQNNGQKGNVWIPDAEVSYTGDHVINLAGGIRTGYCHLGLVKLKLSLKTEEMRLWKGGELFVNAANAHGRSPSFTLTGDRQIMSNIDGGNQTWMQELWYRQSWHKLSIFVGLQDLNNNFVNSEQSAIFLNSSFGVIPVISGNIAAPVYPLTALGIVIGWNANDVFRWNSALFDGSPTDFSRNPYNLRWHFKPGDGLLLITEGEFSPHTPIPPLILKAGVFNHFHTGWTSASSTIDDSLQRNVTGFYLFADKQLWKGTSSGINMFMQAGYSPSHTITNRFFFGGGINFTGFLMKAGNDLLGVAIAHAEYMNAWTETAIELTWNCSLTKYLYLQPDIQYIINPGGWTSSLDNCLTFNLRMGAVF
jgi:porin